MPSLSPFSSHVHPPGYLGSSLRRSRQCTRLLPRGTASASGTEIHKLLTHTLPSLHAQQQQFFPSLLGQRDARQDVGGRLQPKPVCAVCTPVPVPVPRLILAPGTCNWPGWPRQSSRNGPGTKICCYGWTCGDGHMLNGSLPCLRDSHTVLVLPAAAGQWLLSPQRRASYSILPQRLLLCWIYHPIPFLQLAAAGSQTNYRMRRPESS